MILLDTHALVWWVTADRRLTATARVHGARIVTADERLMGLRDVVTVRSSSQGLGNTPYATERAGWLRSTDGRRPAWSL